MFLFVFCYFACLFLNVSTAVDLGSKSLTSAYNKRRLSSTKNKILALASLQLNGNPRSPVEQKSLKNANLNRLQTATVRPPYGRIKPLNFQNCR